MSYQRVLPLILMLACVAACSSLTKEEEDRLNNYKYNASLYYENADYERAEQQCRRGLELAPSDPSLNANLGWAMMWQASRTQNVAKMTEAIAQFHKILDEGLTSDAIPESKALLGLGTCEWWIAQQLANVDAESSRHADLAREYLSEVIDMDPENIVATLTLAQVIIFQGDVQGNNDEWQTGLALLDRGLAQLEQRGKILAKRASQGGLSREAQARFKSQSDLNVTQEVTFRRLKAEVLFKMKKFEPALAEYVNIDELGGMTAIDYYNRGQMQEGLGNRRAAIADYEKYLKQSSGTLDDFVQSVLRRISTLKLEEEGKPLSESK